MNEELCKILFKLRMNKYNHIFMKLTEYRVQEKKWYATIMIQISNIGVYTLDIDGNFHDIDIQLKCIDLQIKASIDKYIYYYFHKEDDELYV